MGDSDRIVPIANTLEDWERPTGMPSTLEALVIVVLVLAPGYVLSVFAAEVIPFARSEKPDAIALLPTITCGALVHAVLSPWTLRVLGYYRSNVLASHTWELVAWGFA